MLTHPGLPRADRGCGIAMMYIVTYTHTHQDGSDNSLFDSEEKAEAWVLTTILEYISELSDPEYSEMLGCMRERSFNNVVEKWQDLSEEMFVVTPHDIYDGELNAAVAKLKVFEHSLKQYALSEYDVDFNWDVPDFVVGAWRLKNYEAAVEVLKKYLDEGGGLG